MAKHLAKWNEFPGLAKRNDVASARAFQRRRARRAIWDFKLQSSGVGMPGIGSFESNVKFVVQGAGCGATCGHVRSFLRISAGAARVLRMCRNSLGVCVFEALVEGAKSNSQASGRAQVG